MEIHQCTGRHQNIFESEPQKYVYSNFPKKWSSEATSIPQVLLPQFFPLLLHSKVHPKNPSSSKYPSFSHFKTLLLPSLLLSCRLPILTATFQHLKFILLSPPLLSQAMTPPKPSR